jgi:hypothetical protein
MSGFFSRANELANSSSRRVSEGKNPALWPDKYIYFLIWEWTSKVRMDTIEEMIFRPEPANRRRRPATYISQKLLAAFRVNFPWLSAVIFSWKRLSFNERVGYQESVTRLKGCFLWKVALSLFMKVNHILKIFCEVSYCERSKKFSNYDSLT